MRAVVLGGSGFIGRWVAYALAQAGAEVIAVVRDGARADAVVRQYAPQAEMVTLDVLDADALASVYRQTTPAITFNLIGYGVDPHERDSRPAQSINANFPAWLCRVIAAHRCASWPGQALVHVGSALEYGTASGDLREATVPQPTTLYGQTKLAGTQAVASECQDSGLGGVTARLFTVYGPGEHPQRLLPSLIGAASDEPLPLTEGRQQRDFTYVEDVADGLLRLGMTPTAPGEVVNLATGTLTSVRRFVEIAAEVLGIPAARLLFGVLPTRAEEMQHAEVAVGRLRQLTGWTPATGVEDGIRKTMDRREEGYR